MNQLYFWFPKICFSFFFCIRYGITRHSCFSFMFWTSRYLWSLKSKHALSKQAKAAIKIFTFHCLWHKCHLCHRQWKIYQGASTTPSTMLRHSQAHKYKIYLQCESLSSQTITVRRCLEAITNIIILLPYKVIARNTHNIWEVHLNRIP